MARNFRTIESIADQKLNNPIFAFRPESLSRAVNYFKQNFRAKVLYAVKTNPEPHIITSLHAQGINAFDVASLHEVSTIHESVPGAEMYFMHPVKSRFAIREAYFNFGVRHFSLDSSEELEKILQETDKAKDLSLFLRLSIPNTYSEINLSEKFGITLQKAAVLLKKMRKASAQLGVCFHVGSQCMHPDAYRIAMRMTAEIVDYAGVRIDNFNVGGGFPSIYPGMIPPAMSEYFNAIHDEFEKIDGHEQMQLLAEPGRALVAESTSVIVRVELRKGRNLHINDGTYGSLFDAGTPKFIFPVRLIRSEDTESSDLIPFSFYGPTCDSLDFMKGPFYLPNDVREGDYIEIGQIGSYGRTMATGFNGFIHEKEIVEVSNPPLMTLYDTEHTLEPLEIIAA